jgi:hypothetical protein
MTFFKLCLLAALVLFVLRLSGRWSGSVPRLPHWVPELLSPRKPAGHTPLASDSDSARADDSYTDDDDEDTEGDWDVESPTDPMISGVILVDQGQPRVAVNRPESPGPGLNERVNGLLRRASGEPKVVHETPDPPPPAEGSRQARAQALIEHLLRERGRPGLPATRIVQAAAGQAHAPWGNVSEATVWRAWRNLPE